MAAPETVLPLCEEEADALFMPLSAFPRLGVAVSGGSDSLALLVLIAEWRQRRPRPLAIRVFTINHGLRAESADEARYVAQMAARFGLTCHTLCWTGEKPSANRQAAARAARQALLTDAVRAWAGGALVLGHHLDDQAETFLLRLARGSGAYGLAAMRMRDDWDDVPVMRPLLSVTKARLQATLRARGIKWCEDPSNTDEAYARIRVRALMPALADEGISAARLGETAARLGRVAAAIDVRVRQFCGDHVEHHPAGPIRVALAPLADEPEEILLRVFARLIRQVAGQPYTPRLDRLERLVGVLADGASVQATLGGAVARREGGQVFFWREAGRTGIAPLRVTGPGRWVWDNRFVLEVSRHMVFDVVALADVDDRDVFKSVPAGWPRASFATAPVLLDARHAPLCPGLTGDTPPEGVTFTARMDNYPLDSPRNPFKTRLAGSD